MKIVYDKTKEAEELTQNLKVIRDHCEKHKIPMLTILFARVIEHDDGTREDRALVSFGGTANPDLPPDFVNLISLVLSSKAKEVISDIIDNMRPEIKDQVAREMLAAYEDAPEIE